MKVKGALDSADAVKALDFFKGLLKYAPPGGSKLGYGEALEPFVNDSSAMLMNYFAFFPDLAKKMGDKVGLLRHAEERRAPLREPRRPGLLDLDARRPPAQQELAKKFIAWFLQEPTQQEWVKKPGGFTANAAILKSDAVQAGEPLQRGVRRVDGHRPGLLERARRTTS